MDVVSNVDAESDADRVRAVERFLTSDVPKGNLGRRRCSVEGWFAKGQP